MHLNPLKMLATIACTVALAVVFAIGVTNAPRQAIAQTAASPITLNNGVAVGPLSDARLAQQHYVFTVPAGATQAVFSIAGGPGDADIYVRRGAAPTTSTWDYRPYRSTSTETVTVNNPQAGTWYLMVRAYSAYSGVTLKATHNASANTNVASTPSFTPAPGTYSGQVSVSLAAATPANATIRFTTDGSTPTAASEVYNAPIVLYNTTVVKAATFATGYTTSATATGNYTINNTLQILSNGAPISNLSGTLGSVSNFRFAVPSGVSSVSFSISGGTGDADLYVKYGQLATTSTFDQRPNLRSNAETVTINTPQAGDYYAMIYGFQAYTGVTITASYSGTTNVGKPDLTISAAALNPRITNETFAANSCDVQEGSITAGTRKLLRFTTQSRNVGTADLVLGNPANNSQFEFGSCHGHYHFRSFAQYRLLDGAGAVVRTGRKVGFCLMDITRISTSANPSARYTCSNQGIQAGWADVYSSNLSGQWIDITGLTAGQYVLEITMDPMNLIDELDESNNTIQSNVTIR